MTADQRGSRRAHDRVPEALALLDRQVGDRAILRFDRTVGDEIQALTDDPACLVEAVLALTRLGGWRIGIGIGTVETPLPTSTREARGRAYVAAREAVELARTSPTDLAVVRHADPEIVGAVPYGGDQVRHAETALILLRSVVARRTPEGWELMDLLDADPSGKHAAASLGISPSAVSQRLARSGREESRRGAELATHLLAGLIGGG
ncbi:MAG: hypothetical protein WAS07_10645 [Micropruina sp.]|nr:hypothetical protein [Micropruina sp.]